MKLEREWGHWEIKALHSRRNQPGLDSKPDVSGYTEERPRKREGDEGWRRGGKGLGLKIWGAKERRPVAQLLSLLLRDSKRTICWSLDSWTESSLSLWFMKPQLSVQVRVIMVLSVNRANWPQLVLSSNIKTNSIAYTAGFELACLLILITITI